MDSLPPSQANLPEVRLLLNIDEGELAQQRAVLHAAAQLRQRYEEQRSEILGGRCRGAPAK
jgi:hypothetical protein